MKPADHRSMTEQEFLTKLTDGVTFRDMHLADADLTHAQAYDVTLKNCTLQNVDFTKASLEGLTCISVQFRNCSFYDSNLQEAVFENCHFYDPDHPKESRKSHSIYPPGGCKFLKANLRSATFTNCDLSFCVFEGATLFQVSITGCKAVAAKFFRATFDNSASLVDNVMHYVDLRGARLSKCDISKTDFQWAHLDEADFSEAILVGSHLSSATLRYTSFEGADLRAANISSFDIRSMNLQGASIYESQMRQLIENCGLVVFPDGR